MVAHSYLACSHLASLKKGLFPDCHLSGRDIVMFGNKIMSGLLNFREVKYNAFRYKVHGFIQQKFA